MKLPEIHINITSTMVAAYAAVVSTVGMAVQVGNYLRDRTRLQVNVMFNRQIYGDPQRDPQKTLIQVNVSNVGRRPITVTSIGVIGLYPHSNAVFLDVHPQIPRELNEGQYVDAFIPQTDFKLAEIRHWEAYTSTGRKFRFNQAPWHKRIISDIRWRMHFRRERKKKATAAKAGK